MQTLLTLVLQVVLAVVVAKLTLAGARSQKWWERKEELYSNLMEKLYAILNYNSQWLDDYQTNPDTLSAEKKASREAEWKELEKQNKEAQTEVEKLIHIGTFRISKEVREALLVFKKDKREAETKHDPYDTYAIVDSICDATKKCIKSVEEHSKNDLGLNSRFWRLIEKIRALFSE